MLKRTPEIEFSESSSLLKLFLNEQRCTMEAAVIFIKIKSRNINFIGARPYIPQICLGLVLPFKGS